MIDERDRREIVRRYSNRFHEFGVDLRTLASGTDERHRIQHAVHASAGDLNRKTVLDIGCGLAHYYAFLRERGLSVNYIGYDVVPEFIDSNRERFPEAYFELRDVSSHGIAHSADYVV